MMWISQMAIWCDAYPEMLSFIVEGDVKELIKIEVKKRNET